MSFDLDVWRTLFGRLHVVVVHFPIALSVVAVLLDMFDRMRPDVARGATVRTLLRLAAPAAVLAASLGWLRAEQEPLGSSVERTLWLHRWIGVGFSVLACLAAIGAANARMRKFVAWPAALLVLVASHFGGTLVYGTDYLTEPFEPRSAVPAPATQLVEPAPDAPSTTTFVGTAQPVFEALCVECHGPTKAKGDLRLDRWSETWFVAQDDRPVLIVRGKPSESELWFRLELPLDDDDHMPPDKEPQPSPAQLDALRRWIEDGARP